MSARYYARFKNRTFPLIQISATHDDFIFPVTMHEIKSVMENVPTQFVEGIKAVLVPSGSKKQIAAMKSLLMFGEYWRDCVVLHPYPKTLMTQVYEKEPNPQVVQGYRRTGAAIVTEGTGIKIIFDEASLKNFYLRDVLMHEIGHHNDRLLEARPKKKREAFANWFASEYGFRLESK
ncbi:ImmA/IrrE family metallo-endopeptidase [Planctomycetota bacterium]